MALELKVTHTVRDASSHVTCVVAPTDSFRRVIACQHALIVFEPCGRPCVTLPRLHTMAQLQMGAEGHQRLEGDHAMLASKPLTGYRCLACDRWANQQNSKAAVLTVPPLSHVATCVAVSRLKVQLLSAVQVPTSVLWDSRFTQVARASRIATDQWPGILSAWTLQAG